MVEQLKSVLQKRLIRLLVGNQNHNGGLNGEVAGQLTPYNILDKNQTRAYNYALREERQRYYQSFPAFLSFGALNKRAHLVVEVLVLYSLDIFTEVNAENDRHKYAERKENAAQPAAGNHALELFIFGFCSAVDFFDIEE